jgi:hypothetical protein
VLTAARADAFRARPARRAWLKVGAMAGIGLVAGVVLSITGAARRRCAQAKRGLLSAGIAGSASV